MTQSDPAKSALIRQLRKALHLLAVPGRATPEDWLLIATLVGEADLEIHERSEPDTELDTLLAEAVEELRDSTRNFTDTDFLRSTRAARRKNPRLFANHR